MNIPDDLIRFDNVLEERGWEQPARLLLIHDDQPFTVLAEVVGVHPCHVLNQMWKAGVRADGATAIALVVEGLRHMQVEEIEAERPEVYAQLVEIAAQGYPDGDFDEIQTAVRNAWMATIAEESPLAMPEDITKRVRNTVVVLHTGETCAVVRDQGGDPQALDTVPRERLELSRVPHFMWQFLEGQEPRD